MEEDSTELSRAVRSALSHLYDNAYLQTHPLTLRWAAGSHSDRLSQAQELRRTLLDCIERLRPPRPRAATLPASMPYSPTAVSTG